MTLAAIADTLNEEAFAALRAKPGFREACEANAAEAVAQFVSLDSHRQWITKDLGRAAICLMALIFHLMDDLTVQKLTAACVQTKVSSAGRVNQVVRRLLEIGELVIEDGPRHWTRRPARLQSDVVEMLRNRGLVDLAAAVTLADELSSALDIARGEAGFRDYVISAASVTTIRRDLFAFSGTTPLDFFFDREAGMVILFDLLTSQPHERDRLLERAPLSRYALSRRYGISRAHINKMIAESNELRAEGDCVVFSSALSEHMERYFALVFQLNLGIARTLLDGWRFVAG